MAFSSGSIGRSIDYTSGTQEYIRDVGSQACYYKKTKTTNSATLLYVRHVWTLSYSNGKYTWNSLKVQAKVGTKVSTLYSNGSVTLTHDSSKAVHNLTWYDTSWKTIFSINKGSTYSGDSSWSTNLGSGKTTLTYSNAALKSSTTSATSSLGISFAKAKFTITYTTSGSSPIRQSGYYGQSVTLLNASTYNSSYKSSNNHTITLSYNSGESGNPAPSSQSQTVSESITHIAYAWNIGSSGGSYTIKEDVTATPRWTTSSGGIPNATFTLDNGDSMGKEEPLSKTNYLYYNMNGGNGNIPTISKQITRTRSYLFVGWKIDYDTFSGGDTYSTNESKTATGQYNIFLPDWEYQDVVISSIQPTRTGYNFLGWATTSTATSASYLGGDALTLDKDITLYAVWEPEKHSTIVHFYSMSNGKYDQIKIREDMVYEGYYNTNTSNSYIAIPVINGYQTPSVLSTDLKNTSIVSTKLDYTADHEYYVLYTLLFNTITLNLNSVSGATTLLNNSPSNYTYQYCVRDNTQEIRSNYIPTSVLGNTRYCFLGWNTLANGSGSWIESIIPSNVTQWGVTNTYYAQWLPLGRYIYKNNAWHGITNMWVYSNGVWKTTDTTSYTNDLLKTKTTFWTYKDGSWHKEYGGRL